MFSIKHNTPDIQHSLLSVFQTLSSESPSNKQKQIINLNRLATTQVTQTSTQMSHTGAAVAAAAVCGCNGWPSQSITWWIYLNGVYHQQPRLLKPSVTHTATIMADKGGGGWLIPPHPQVWQPYHWPSPKDQGSVDWLVALLWRMQLPGTSDVT